MNWHTRAACASADPDLFFPEPEASAARIAKAKAYCAECPVKQSCLEDAMQRNDTDSLSGGLTAAERVQLVAPHGRPVPQGVGRMSAREMAVRHGTYVLTSLVKWRMEVQEVAASLGSTPRAVYSAYRILVPSRPGRREPQKVSSIEELLGRATEQLKAMERRGYAHEDIGRALKTSQSLVSASLSVLRQRDRAIRELGEEHSDVVRLLQQEEHRVRREAGVGLTVGDVIDLAGPRILRMHGEGVPLRQVAYELGICRETVRRAYLRLANRNLTRDELGEAA